MMAGGMSWCLFSPPLIKPLLQGIVTRRGLHNALQCARMGQSQWTAGTEKRKRRGERHLRHSRLSPFHLQPDSYFLKLSTRWILRDYFFPLRLSLLFFLPFKHFIYTQSISLFFFYFINRRLTECAFKCLWKTRAPKAAALNTSISKNHSSQWRHLAPTMHKALLLSNFTTWPQRAVCFCLWPFINYHVPHRRFPDMHRRTHRGVE